MSLVKEDFQALREFEDANTETGLTLELGSLMQADKALIGDISRHLVDRVACGELDAVKAFIHAKKILEVATSLVDNIRPYLANHLNIAKGEKLVMYNVEFAQTETGVKYDYLSSNDPEYKAIHEEFEILKKKKEAKEKELKAMTTSKTLYDEDTSELIKITPPIKKGKLGYTTEIK